MKLGEIKLESLRLINANDQKLSIENIDKYMQDDRYRDYLEKMPGAINRALSRFATYKILPTKTAEIKPAQGKSVKQFLRFDLNKIISDFNSLERIIYIHERVVPNINYQTVSSGVIIVPFSSSCVFKGEVEELPQNPTVGDAVYIQGGSKYYTGEHWDDLAEDEIFEIEYTPKIQIVNVNTPNDLELNVPEAMARMIPYFIKADIYEQDEPEVAATARNIFESALTEYISFGMDRKQRQLYVENVMF
jgi:hypothetical protein